MTFTLLCKCGKAIVIPDEHKGAKVRCKSCGRIMRAGKRRSAFSRFVADVSNYVVRLAIWATRPTAKPRRSPWLRAIAPLEPWMVRASWAYLFGVVGVALALWSIGDVWWIGTVLLFIGRWVFLLPLLALVPGAALLRPRLFLPIALAALVVIGPVMGAKTGWRRFTSHPKGQHVRLVSFNTDGGQVIAPTLKQFIEDFSADIVALQECGEELTEASRHVEGWYHHDVRGLCFLSRFRILDSAVMDRSALKIIQYNEAAGIGGSGDVARYKLLLPSGVVIHVTNLHLETPRKGLEGLLHGDFGLTRLRENTILRSVESELARRWVNVGGQPTLVTGDFNTPVESRIFRRNWGDLTDAFNRIGAGLGMTKYNGWIRARIDHVLTGPGWYADQVRIGPEYGSDHRPLIVDLTLAPGQ